MPVRIVTFVKSLGNHLNTIKSVEAFDFKLSDQSEENVAPWRRGSIVSCSVNAPGIQCD